MIESKEPVSKKSSFPKIGAICFLIGLFINIVFMKLNVGGIMRELSRLAILVGLFLMVFGGIYNLFKKK